MFRSLIRARSQSSSSLVTMSSITQRGNSRPLSEAAGSHSRDKILVLGGNGYVGSHICKEALRQGFSVSSLSRSGRSSLHDSWVNDVTWHQGILSQNTFHFVHHLKSKKISMNDLIFFFFLLKQIGDLLSPDSLKPALEGITSVISCVGGFGSNSQMVRINGTANINAVKAAAEGGVKRFVYISAADYGVINNLIRGYFQGKRATEAEILDKFGNRGTVLRPGFIHGTRQVGSIKLPLSLIGAPLEMVLKLFPKEVTKIPLIGPLLIPPVSVKSVAGTAVKAAVDPEFASGVVDVYQILQHKTTPS
ncbi:uncharacterized protein At1g32220, chloroplastic-like isoform X1 [Brassica napus]|uniref:uncharacterized protein At1g32220, chloroplastic isoform X1 n=1 Tax=Brassica napus TaxID=3708 RepID=UPI002079022D|nr:uncharacterized protein At1g32220, chloroplastic isoform X1 [Brassica napus]XP_048604607.1 uncharacterized protein At1g32220, chloroplastic-like isoform X1 [Brassica napus]